MSATAIRARGDGPPPSAFATALGIEIVSCGPDEVVCRMPVSPTMANRNGVLHGGALMALADSAAGALVFVNGTSETTSATVEAKTNFLRAVQIGDTLTARCTLLHGGRRMQVVQIVMTRADGRTVGVSTQTHMPANQQANPAPGDRA